jgi:hypothetical protein
VGHFFLILVQDIQMRIQSMEDFQQDMGSKNSAELVMIKEAVREAKV